MVTEHLGTRNLLAVYSYADLIKQLFFIAAIGGDALDDSHTFYSVPANGFTAKKLAFVDRSMRMKNFILHFVTLPAKWIKTGRQWVLKIFTQKNYSPLWVT